MCTFDWERFLVRWNQESLLSGRCELSNLPPQIIQSGWLGYPPATEVQIRKTEERLGVILPRSYREFLKVSNGWYLTTPFVYKLWAVDEIEWFATRRRTWKDDFTERYKSLHHMNMTSNGSDSCSKLPSIPDEEYKIYGDDQESTKLRVEYLETALEISDRADSTIYLLNPQIKAKDGEWEAWFLEDASPDTEPMFYEWCPGAKRYPSFLEMMQEEYRSFMEI